MSDLCGCCRYKPHHYTGDPWCECGHQYSRHAEGGEACEFRSSEVTEEIVVES